MKNINNLNERQQQAVAEINSPVLIFAGAGSGKTRVLTHKIVHLIQSEAYSPQNILAVTFTNKAAMEMKTRIQKMLPQVDPYIMNIGTFHSIAARILRIDGHLLGYNRNFTIYDTDDGKKLIKNIVKDMNLNASLYHPRTILSFISRIKNNLLTSEDILSQTSNAVEVKMVDIFNEYQEQLKNNNAMDFDELLLQPLNLFKNYPEKLVQYQQKFQYILVDEYQDTNKPQFEFIRALAGDRNHITVVGDDDQSIYGWRGADISNILEFETSFPEAKIFKLEQNYRSTKNILTAAHAVVKNNRKRAPKKLWTSNDAGETLVLRQLYDEQGEASFIGDQIRNLYRSGRKKFSEVAILYRTNAQSRAIEEKLMGATIPYTIVGGVKFFERKEIKDVLAYLRLIVNNNDNMSFDRIINFPSRGLGQTTLRKLSVRARQTRKSLYESLEQADSLEIRPAQKASMKNFRNIIEKYKSRLATENAAEIALSLISAISLESHFIDQNSDEEYDRWNNVNELIRGMELFCSENKNNSLADYLENVSLQTDIDRWNDSLDSVTLMTVHSAKGLEFPLVFITGMEDRLFPLRIDDDSDLEEERRLFYVAVTRAKERVFLSYAYCRRRYGGADPSFMVRSEFLDQIPPDILDEKLLPKDKLRTVNGLPEAETWKHRMTGRRSVSTSPVTSQDAYNEIVTDQIVDHKIWGKGRVINVEGVGDRAKITVLFSGNTQKKLIAKYAGLKILES